MAAAAAEHRARLIAEGRLPSSEVEEDVDDAGETQTTATPGSAPTQDPPTAVAAPAPLPIPASTSENDATGVGNEALLARLEALERRVEELEDLIAS